MEDVTTAVLSVVSSGHVEKSGFFITGGQLDRKLYSAVNEVLENLGGKWNRKLKAHVFETDPTDKIEDLLLTGKTTNEKKLYQFFETPLEVAERIVELADIRDGMTVLEPSVGRGALVDAIPKGRDIGLVCIELDPKHLSVLAEKGYPTQQGDFMSFSEAACNVDKNPEDVTNEDLRYCLAGFDRIIMNPPFARQQDIDHVLHAYEILSEGGRLVAVMSPGFTFRQNRKSVAFLELVAANGSYEELPEGTFAESGTNVRTIIVCLDKKSSLSTAPRR